jgi:molybdopterin molybdotransferase
MARAMISLEEAQSRLLALVKPLPPETLPLIEAAGRWAAEDVISKRTQPARPLSAMDGYAIASGGNGPWRMVGESAAGHPFAGNVAIGEAIRIFTGAAVPDGADTILIQENVTREGDGIRADPADVPVSGRHIRRQGSDFCVGDVLVRQGERLTPARVALAASGGHGRITVHRRPRIALIATGNELVPPGTEAGLDLLPESNTTMIQAMFHNLPCEINNIGIIPDDLPRIAEAIRSVDADLLITIGGASVGDHDLVKPALEQCGASLDFWKVAIRPGKPVMAGQLGEMIILGLPGNPVSAFVTALLFAKPVTAALSGSRDPLPCRTAMQLAVPLPANGDRTDHVRARMIGDGVAPVGPNDSAAMGGLAAADCLIVRLPNAPAAIPGDKVPTLLLD